MNAVRRDSLLLNLLLWAGLYVLWLFVFRNHELAFSRTVSIEFCYLVFIAFNFYFHVSFALPRYLRKGEYFTYSLFSLLFLLLTSAMRAEVALYISTTFYHVPEDQLPIVRLFLNSLLNITIWSVILVSGKVLLDRINFERYAERVEKEKILNELNFLRSQHNPHFLFNTLNSVYFQIDKNNKDARETLMRLSEILRYQLYDCSTEKIAIEKEVAYLHNYVGLQQLRFNKDHQIIFVVDENVRSFSIAPLLMMPLVENAFKHVSHYTSQPNFIRILISAENGSLSCAISNTVERPNCVSHTLNGGIGLKNLQRRLELLYPAQHELNINDNGLEYSARLSLKIA